MISGLFNTRHCHGIAKPVRCCMKMSNWVRSAPFVLSFSESHMGQLESDSSLGSARMSSTKTHCMFLAYLGKLWPKAKSTCMSSKKHSMFISNPHLTNAYPRGLYCGNCGFDDALNARPD